MDKMKKREKQKQQKRQQEKDDRMIFCLVLGALLGMIYVIFF